MKKHWIPLLIFIALIVLLAVGLHLNPRQVPSPFIGKPAPELWLPDLFQPDKEISSQMFKGQVWLLSVWASWCGACQREHTVLNHLVRSRHITLVGLDYKDNSEDAKAWLATAGNPYVKVGIDQQGLTGIDWGVYGVPETFVIDKKGIIRHKYIGPLTQEKVTNSLLPLLMQLEEESS